MGTAASKTRTKSKMGVKPDTHYETIVPIVSAVPPSDKSQQMPDYLIVLKIILPDVVCSD